MRAATVFVIALLLSLACAHRPDPKELDAIRDELLAMRDADQEVRRRWLADRENKELIAEVEAVDARHVARLNAIVKRLRGWPGKSLVGQKASAGAWFIAQHGGPEVLHRMLPLMEKAVKRGDLDSSLYATSVDRVRIQDGKKQLYGSQFNTSGDACEPLPIEDPEHVEERRAAIGLGPLSEYTKQLCEMYKKKP